MEHLHHQRRRRVLLLIFGAALLAVACSGHPSSVSGDGGSIATSSPPNVGSPPSEGADRGQGSDPGTGFDDGKPKGVAAPSAQPLCKGPLDCPGGFCFESHLPHDGVCLAICGNGIYGSRPIAPSACPTDEECLPLLSSTSVCLIPCSSDVDCPPLPSASLRYSCRIEMRSGRSFCLPVTA